MADLNRGISDTGGGEKSWVWEGTKLLMVEFSDSVSLKESCVCSGDGTGVFVRVSKCRCVKTHSCECSPLSGDSNPQCLSA